MAKVRTSSSSDNVSKIRPALTPEARELQMIDLAVSLAEKQLQDGTASSQVITHFLKLATEKTKLEQEKLRQDIRLQEAKTESLHSAKRVEELYTNALNAMRNYNGQGDPDEY